MYNRYIPEDTSYTPVEEETPTPEREDPSQVQPPGTEQKKRESSFRLSALLGGKEGLSGLFSGREKGGLSGLAKSLKLGNIDTGDVLLLLIILYLLVEGDDLELVIALGLVLLMGLGEE